MLFFLICKLRSVGEKYLNATFCQVWSLHSANLLIQKSIHMYSENPDLFQGYLSQLLSNMK